MGCLYRYCQDWHPIALPRDIREQSDLQSCDIYLTRLGLLLRFVGDSGRLGYVSPYGQNVESEHCRYLCGSIAFLYSHQWNKHGV